MDIRELIKTKRQAMGMTQEELGILIGKKRCLIAKYETGRVKKIPIESLKALATVLKIPVETLWKAL